MPRRGSNIYKRKDGRWEGRLKKENQAGKSRSYLSVYGRTYGEVKDKMKQIQRSQLKAEASCICRLEEMMTVWLEDHKSGWKASTYATYRQMTEKHILPEMGKLRISRITAEELEDFVRRKRCGNGKKPLSNGYLHNICSVVLQALAYGRKKFGYEIQQPDVALPKFQPCDMLLPGEKKLAVLEEYLLEHAQEDTTSLGVLLATYTGIRIGELCALTWGDVNMEEEVLYIRRNMQRIRLFDGQKIYTKVVFQTPKTLKSARLIPIPRLLLPLLEKHRGMPEEFIIKGKKQKWAEPRTVQYRFLRILRQCKIEAFNFHKLRHSFATRCISKGFDVKSLSEILGHSNVQITLNLYVHSTLQQKKQLMNLFQFFLHQEQNL